MTCVQCLNDAELHERPCEKREHCRTDDNVPHTAGNALDDDDADDDDNDDGDIVCQVFHNVRYSLLLEELAEVGRYLSLEFHSPMVYRMIEAELVGMQAEPSHGVVAVAVLDISANGVSHVG